MRHRTKGGKSEAGQSKTLEDVYPEVQKMMGEDFQRSKVTKSAEGSGKVSPNFWGESVERAEYSWGSRMSFPELDEFKNLQGMVVMGDSKQSSFLTFRVISVNSPLAINLMGIEEGKTVTYTVDQVPFKLKIKTVDNGEQGTVQ